MADTPTGAEELTDQAVHNQHPKKAFFEATYGGVLSFCRRPYTRNLRDVDVAVVGVPWDGAVTNRPGARLGPRAIRQASTQLAELKSFAFGINPFHHLGVVDFGDMALNPHDPTSIVDQITAGIDPIVKAGVIPLALGGDHFIAYALLKAQAEKHGPVALVQFDAHADTWDSAGPLDHGTMFKRAVNEGLVDVNRSIQVGIRTHTDNSLEIEQITAPECHDLGPSEITKRIVNRSGAGPAYLSFDIDCLDPAFAPGTGTPVCGGLTTWQALEIIRGIKELSFVAMDLVEVSPPFDTSEISALAAASIAYDWLAGLAVGRSKK